MRSFIALAVGAICATATPPKNLKLQSRKSFDDALAEWAKGAPTENEDEMLKSAMEFKRLQEEQYPGWFGSCAELERAERNGVIGSSMLNAMARSMNCQIKSAGPPAAAAPVPAIVPRYSNDVRIDAAVERTRDFYDRQNANGNDASSLWQLCSESMKWKVETSKSEASISGKKCASRFPHLVTRCSPLETPSCTVTKSRKLDECVVPVKCTSPQNTYRAIDVLMWNDAEQLENMQTADIRECDEKCELQA